MLLLVGVHAFFVQNPQDICVADSLLLEGRVGAGKTCFARGFIQGILGVQTIVPSPTFTILQHYQFQKQHIFHYDLYRLGDADSLYDVDWQEVGATGISLIEWPERIEQEMMPKDYWRWQFSVGENEEERQVSVTGCNALREAACFSHLQARSFEVCA